MQEQSVLTSMQEQGVFFQIYLLFRYAVVALVVAAVAVMFVRLIFNYLDPNPFGTFGRFASWLRQQTEPLVRPAAQMLGRNRMDVRIAPLVTVLGLCLVAYFFLQLLWNVFFTINGVVDSSINGRVVALVGYILYGILAVYSLLIIMRIIFSWFLSHLNPLQRFLVRVTDPVLEPFRRMIPPLGFIDISPIVVLFLMNLLQAAVMGVLIAAPRSFQ
jgi:YggT family protein